MSYNSEQLEALRTVRRHLGALSDRQYGLLRGRVAPYLSFRNLLDQFLADHFAAICTEACFRSRLSACCTREGIVVFFADVVVNAVEASSAELDALERVLSVETSGPKCAFLSQSGCLWRIRPIVCAMFLCDEAMRQARSTAPGIDRQWEALKARRKDFTWPDKPVLFDELEQIFIDAGIRSPLMHLHDSPGLLRIKKNAGLLSLSSRS